MVSARSNQPASFRGRIAGQSLWSGRDWVRASYGGRRDATADAGTNINGNIFTYAYICTCCFR